MIRLVGLGKRYGRHVALRDVNLEVPDGVVFGLIGPNGSGKTTALRLIAGLTQPTAGAVLVTPPATREGRATGFRVGYLPQHAVFNGVATPRETVALFARLRGLPGGCVNDSLRDGGLEQDADRPVRALSGGMRQRLALAVACLGHPSVLLLDEPTAGLDPRAAIELRVRVRRLASSGCTVIMSSHSLPELEAVCDGLAMLVEGRIAAQGAVSALKARASDGSLDRLFMEAVS